MKLNKAARENWIKKCRELRTKRRDQCLDLFILIFYLNSTGG